MISLCPYKLIGEFQRDQPKEPKIGGYYNFPYFLALFKIEGKGSMVHLFQVYYRSFAIALCIILSINSWANSSSNKHNKNFISDTALLEGSAPVAVNDTIGLIKKTPTNIYVLENDYDPDGANQIDPASIVIVENPDHGTLTIDYVNGIISYKSAANYEGLDDFEYTVTDFDGNISNSSEVQITVLNNKNRFPEAICQNGEAYLDENGFATFSPQDLDNGSTPGNYGSQPEIVKWLVDREEVPVLNCSELGAHEVTLTVTTNMYLSSTCNATIMVYDTISPEVSYTPEDIFVYCVEQGAEAVVNYDLPLFSDNCNGENLEGVLIEGKSSGSLFPVGTTTISYSFTDSEDNGPVISSFNIHVLPKPQTGSIFSTNN